MHSAPTPALAGPDSQNIQRDQESLERLALLEALMDAAWPALDTAVVNGWKLRSAGSVTQRANSIWPVSHPDDPAAALRAATQWYSNRRQPVIFQLTHSPVHAVLEGFLDQSRYSRQSETLIMTAAADSLPAPALPAAADVHITLDTVPPPGWLELWWRVDGRGGPAERVIAEQIFLGVPAIYATAFDADGQAVGTGRLALPQVEDAGGWGGIYAMAVDPGRRRQGIAACVLAALLAAGRESGVGQFWLMVTAANAGSRELYSRAGFAEVGRYHYRQAPLRRALGAC